MGKFPRSPGQREQLFVTDWRGVDGFKRLFFLVSHALLILLGMMVISQQMEHAVYKQVNDFTVNGMAELCRLAQCLRNVEQNVTQKIGAGIAVPSCLGTGSGRVKQTVWRQGKAGKAEHIGCTVNAAPGMVHLPDVQVIRQHQVDQAWSIDALQTQTGPRGFIKCTLGHGERNTPFHLNDQGVSSSLTGLSGEGLCSSGLSMGASC